MDLAEHKLAKILNLHRTINGASKAAADLTVALIKLVGIEFVKRQDQRFVYMSAGVLELLNHGFLDLENMMYQKAIDIANANSPDVISAKAIKEMMADRIGPMGTVKGMLQSNNQNIFKRVANEMGRLNAEGHGTDVIRNAIIGTPSQGYSNGVLGRSIKGNETLMRTAAVMADESANDAARRKDRNTTGYIWVSVLDGHTTITCAALNGRKYYYADSGIKPLPPQHGGCRSSTEAITKSDGIPEVASLDKFIKNNPTEAREMLGKTRYDLYVDGKLKIERFTDRHFTPLTVEQLREKNAVAFERLDK